MLGYGDRLKRKVSLADVLNGGQDEKVPSHGGAQPIKGFFFFEMCNIGPGPTVMTYQPHHYVDTKKGRNASSHDYEAQTWGVITEICAEK